MQVDSPVSRIRLPNRTVVSARSTIACALMPVDSAPHHVDRASGMAISPRRQVSSAAVPQKCARTQLSSSRRTTRCTEHLVGSPTRPMSSATLHDGLGAVSSALAQRYARVSRDASRLGTHASRIDSDASQLRTRRDQARGTRGQIVCMFYSPPTAKCTLPRVGTVVAGLDAHAHWQFGDLPHEAPR